VQLTARDVFRMSHRPAVKWVAASVHDHAELVRAAELGCDFAVLGSVLPTASHPGGMTLGWDGFADIARQTPLPLYAIGGLLPRELPTARAAGAHGIALLRAAWQS
jgi:8-oxo-dGTP diphosphatase